MKNTFSSLAAITLTMCLASGVANAQIVSVSDWSKDHSKDHTSDGCRNDSKGHDSNMDENHHWLDVCDHHTDSGKNETHDGKGTTPPYVSPVPEPQTYAMMLAGLGLIGFSARRKMNT